MNVSVTITGRLGHDPEIRHTNAAGKSVCNLSIAVNERVPRGAGYVERTTWHRVVLWQGLAEDARSLRKGSVIRVSGSQKSRTFTGRDGETRTIVEIVAENFDVLDSLPKTPARAPAKTQSSNGVPRAVIPAGNSPEIDDSDIPF
jgi:single-strand DNA-binding protein